MMEQYTLLRKENDLLNSLIGKSFNEKSKFEAEKILNEIHSIAQGRLIDKKTLCYVTDKDEIKGVGGSTLMKDKNGQVVSNLFLDNLGKILTSLFNAFPTVTSSPTLKNESGGNRTVRLFTGQNFTNNVAKGVVHTLGSGTTVPARTDFNVATPFVIAPENANIDPTDPAWDSPTGSFKSGSVISAGGSGTVNESVLKCGWNDSQANNSIFALFRDIISPGLVFTPGQLITLEYTVQL